MLARKVNLLYLDFAMHLKAIVYLVICGVLLATSSLSGQQLMFKHITEEDGLSASHVNCLLEDDLGFLWFGTQDGLNKFDGYQIRIFRNEPGDSASIPSSCVNTALQFSLNLIILGTREGIVFFNPVTETFSGPAPHQFQLSSPVLALIKLNEETVLVGNEAGLFALNVQTRKITQAYFAHEQKVKVNALARIENQIYIATDEKGLWWLPTPTHIRHIWFSADDLPQEVLNLGALRSITAIGYYGGKIYLGTRLAGVYKTSLKHEILARIKTGVPATDAIHDFVFQNNRLFAATDGGLVVHQLLNSQFRLFSRTEDPLSLNARICTAILKDKQNNLWIGTNTGGVNISFFRSQKFQQNLETLENKSQNSYCFAEPQKDIMLIGTESGLLELNLKSGRKKTYNLPKKSTILCLYVQKQENIWIGTKGQGLLLLERSTGKWKSLLDPLIAGTITDLKKNGPSVLAASMGDGLFNIDPMTKDYQQYTETEGLLNNNLNTIFIDNKKRLWLGTNDQGMLRYVLPLKRHLNPDKVFKNSGKPAQIASNMVLSIIQDRNGTIWAATSAGLSRLLPGDTFQNYHMKDGLANTFVCALLKDSLGEIWASSNGGLIRFDPSRPPTEVSFRNYSMKDGLQNSEYNRGAAMVRENGTIIFGGPHGFNIFRPTQIKDNLHCPEVVLLSYKRGGKDVITDSVITYKRLLTLGPKENFLQFEMAALDFTDPSKNKFRYLLEGFDADWSEPTSIRYVSYNDLPGGTYLFKVKAANIVGAWNEKAMQLKIIVVPPFWKTKTFYLLVIILILCFFYFYNYFRTRVLLRENRLLEQRVCERTKELEEKNRDITSSIEYARRIQEAILPSRDYIFNRLNNAFILYQPKDIVSGDFYWFAEQNGIHVFAVVDCTGHGVPGAFMSMIGHNLLHQIVGEKRITEPGEILDHLHVGIQLTLRQGRNEVQTNDGMDVSIICLHRQGKIKWAGANRPLLIIDPSGEVQRIEGDKFPLGGVQFQKERRFSTHEIVVERGSMAYLFSDGYADQFGGLKGKKFMLRRFHALLGDIHLMSAEEQQQALRQNFEDWRQNHEQVDDVLIVGIQL